MCIYIYICDFMCIYTHIYIYIYIWKKKNHAPVSTKQSKHLHSGDPDPLPFSNSWQLPTNLCEKMWMSFAKQKTSLIHEKWIITILKWMWMVIFTDPVPGPGKSMSHIGPSAPWISQRRPAAHHLGSPPARVLWNPLNSLLHHPLVNVDKKPWKITILNGKTHYFCNFNGDFP